MHRERDETEDALGHDAAIVRLWGACDDDLRPPWMPRALDCAEPGGPSPREEMR
jgi:hypothetical protein